RSVGNALASALAPLIFEKRGDLAFIHARADGTDCRGVRGDGSVGGFPNQRNFAVVFDHAERIDERANDLIRSSVRKGIGILKPGERLNRVRFLTGAGNLGIELDPMEREELDYFNEYLV